MTLAETMAGRPTTAGANPDDPQTRLSATQAGKQGSGTLPSRKGGWAAKPAAARKAGQDDTFPVQWDRWSGSIDEAKDTSEYGPREPQGRTTREVAFALVDAEKAPTFRRKAIFDKILGPLERERVAESIAARNASRLRALEYAKAKDISEGGWGTVHHPRFKEHMNPAEMSFKTLIMYWYTTTGNPRAWNWVFPIDTDPYLVRRWPKTDDEGFPEFGEIGDLSFRRIRAYWYGITDTESPDIVFPINTKGYASSGGSKPGWHKKR